MAETELNAEELDSLLGTKSQVTNDMPDEGEWLGEVDDYNVFNKPGQWDGDDFYATLCFYIRNLDNPGSNSVKHYVTVYADKDPNTNDWVRNEDGTVRTRGLGVGSPRTPWGKLLQGCWAKEEDRMDRSPRDVVGCQMTVVVKYELKKNSITDYKAVHVLIPLKAKK